MNEYLREFNERGCERVHLFGGRYPGGRSAFEVRDELITKYAWGVPSPEALHLVAKQPQPIIEMGAGTGYWAFLLQEMGVEIIPFDAYPAHVRLREDEENPNYGRKEWTKVHEGSHEKLADFPQCKTLFLCWPYHRRPMAFDCLKAFRGDTVIYVGESATGCTGDAEFHSMLRREWEEETYVVLPQFGGMHDYLAVFRRV